MGDAGAYPDPGLATAGTRTMSKSWQVYKFGGSSLGTSGRLPKVLELVVAAPRPLALVV